jgi:hypothetical protein
MPTFWAHCKDCGEHFESRDGKCTGCRYSDAITIDRGAEAGCPDCLELEAIEKRLSKARATIAAREQQ